MKENINLLSIDVQMYYKEVNLKNINAINIISRIKIFTIIITDERTRSFLKDNQLIPS